ncbi:hypothetical protein BMS3Abin17_00725 [archaeon BMS3Abin17]|nr:hypothetical protein BMS3Abin17_00725 [archaeon BMS3Abin17]HDZ61023.1 hypothetical protein [Candidatus Pacearchaeota archaeon]
MCEKTESYEGWINISKRLPLYTRKDITRPLNEQGNENDMTASDNVLVSDKENSVLVAYCTDISIMGSRRWVAMPISRFTEIPTILDSVEYWKPLKTFQ